MAFGIDDESKVRKWFFRIASLAALVATFAAIGHYMSRGEAFPAGLLVVIVVPIAVLVSWSWTGSVFTSLARAKRYVEGVEGDVRHEWYAFKGQRVRVFLDDDRQSWFAFSEIAQMLDLQAVRKHSGITARRSAGSPIQPRKPAFRNGDCGA